MTLKRDPSSYWKFIKFYAPKSCSLYSKLFFYLLMKLGYLSPISILNFIASLRMQKSFTIVIFRFTIFYSLCINNKYSFLNTLFVFLLDSIFFFYSFRAFILSGLFSYACIFFVKDSIMLSMSPYCWSIFWWWLLHWLSDFVPMNSESLLKTLVTLLVYSS